MPGQYGVGFDDIGYFFKCLLAELFIHFGQCFALGVGELDAFLDLIA
jgi:hypothetical protein